MKNEGLKLNLLSKIAGYLVIFFYFILFLVDRILHILLPHREHDKFTIWVKDPENIKYTFSRLLIFMIPILIFNLFI